MASSFSHAQSLVSDATYLLDYLIVLIINAGVIQSDFKYLVVVSQGLNSSKDDDDEIDDRFADVESCGESPFCFQHVHLHCF